MSKHARLSGAHAVGAHLRLVLAEPWSELAAIFGAPAVLTARKHHLIETVLPGIYAAADAVSDFRVRARAITIWAGPDGVITGLAAAHLWRIVDNPPDRLTVQVPYAWHLKGPRWVRPLRIGSWRRRYETAGIALVSAPDAVVQSWREAPVDVGVATVIAAIVRERASASDLLDALARRKQLPRRAQLTELIGLAGTVVTSYLEYIAWREVFPPRLFPHLQWQVGTWANGRKRVMDAFDPEARIDLEFDGGSSHGGIDGFERDRQRDADMRSEGIVPLHFTYRDLILRPGWCRHHYREVRESRLRRGAPVLGDPEARSIGR